LPVNLLQSPLSSVERQFAASDRQTFDLSWRDQSSVSQLAGGVE